MKSSRTITLFSESRDIGPRSTSFAASVLFHCIAASLLSFGVMYTPRLDTRAIAERYTVRNIDLETPEQRAQRDARKNVRYPGPRKPESPPKAKLAAGKPTPQPPLLRQIAKAQKGPQTLVQPDLPAQLTLKQEVPVPTIVIWSPKKADVKTVIAPQPEKATAADVKPMPDPPNLEAVDLSNMSIAAVQPFRSPKLPTPPSTTSPVAIHAPDRVQMAPATVSQPTAATNPCGDHVALRFENGARHGRCPLSMRPLPPMRRELLAPGAAHDPSAAGNGNQARQCAGTGTGEAQPNAADPGARCFRPQKGRAQPLQSPSTGDSASGQNNQPTPPRRSRSQGRTVWRGRGGRVARPAVS
jgi:hypothetical protein